MSLIARTTRVSHAKRGWAPSARRRRRRSMSIVESVMAIVVVGTMMVAAVDTVGSVTKAQSSAADRGRAKLLALALVSEIQSQYYEEPDLAPLFGVEGTELTSSRSGWDDVDDYDGWSASPPQQRSGTEIPKTEGWTRSVVVEFVWPDDPNTVVGSDLGAKRITVTVRYNDKVMATLSALRANTGMSAVFDRRPTIGNATDAVAATDNAVADGISDAMLNGNGNTERMGAAAAALLDTIATGSGNAETRGTSAEVKK